MNLDINEINGACHCGAVRFTVKLTDGLRTARRCTCSYCRMRGAVAVSANLDGIAITAGEDVLTLYQFNTNTAKHYFVRDAASIHIINAAPIPTSMASTWHALKA